MGRFVVSASCLRRSPPQAAAGAVVRLRRHGPAGPGGRPHAGTHPTLRHKELCREVDRLDTQDQEVVCHVMDSLIRKERMKAILDDRLPRGG